MLLIVFNVCFGMIIFGTLFWAHTNVVGDEVSVIRGEDRAATTRSEVEQIKTAINGVIDKVRASQYTADQAIAALRHQMHLTSEEERLLQQAGRGQVVPLMQLPQPALVPVAQLEPPQQQPPTATTPPPPPPVITNLPQLPHILPGTVGRVVVVVRVGVRRARRIRVLERPQVVDEPEERSLRVCREALTVLLPDGVRAFRMPLRLVVHDIDLQLPDQRVVRAPRQVHGQGVDRRSEVVH